LWQGHVSIFRQAIAAMTPSSEHGQQCPPYRMSCPRSTPLDKVGTRLISANHRYTMSPRSLALTPRRESGILRPWGCGDGVCSPIAHANGLWFLRRGRGEDMPKMTGGQALAKSLYREGVRVIFGLPGVQLYHLLDGLYDEPGIRFVTPRHEQATSYMADGYARAGGGIGTALVVPGPGLQNASAGIGTAYAASSPILVISGQIERDLIGVDRGMLHEVNDQMDTIRPVTKWAARILKPQDVPDVVQEAFRQLRTGRHRHWEVEIPPE